MMGDRENKVDTASGVDVGSTNRWPPGCVQCRFWFHALTIQKDF
jgi:hypothetical protein